MAQGRSFTKDYIGRMKRMGHAKGDMVPRVVDMRISQVACVAADRARGVWMSRARSRRATVSSACATAKSRNRRVKAASRHSLGH